MMDDAEYKPDTKDPLVFEARYASRKFLIAVGLLVTNTVLLYAGLIDKALYVDGQKWITGLYMAGNVGTWLAEAMKGKT